MVTDFFFILNLNIALEHLFIFTIYLLLYSRMSLKYNQECWSVVIYRHITEVVQMLIITS